MQGKSQILFEKGSSFNDNSSNLIYNPKKKKWLKLTRKGLLLSSICKVGKIKQGDISNSIFAF